MPGDPTTYYFGSTGGGIWKSTDAATTWKPVFDHEKSSSIGSLAVAPSDPNVIYAGTGEALIRGNAATGDGIYKSVDAGKSWKNVGLRDSRATGKLIVDPHDPDTDGVGDALAVGAAVAIRRIAGYGRANASGQPSTASGVPAVLP